MFSPEAYLDSRLLAKARTEEEEELRKMVSPSRRLVDQIITFQPGSFIGRVLGNYREILGHNGVVDFLEVAESLGPTVTVVDAGCGGGLALARLRSHLPDARLVGIDNRYTPDNTIVDQTDVPIGTVAQLFEKERVEFHQNIFLNVNQILPEGYGVLLSVVGFYDDETPDKPHAAALKMFYDGLQKGGIVQMLYNPSYQTWDTVQRCLIATRIPFSFVKGKSGGFKEACHNCQKWFSWNSNPWT